MPLGWTGSDSAIAVSTYDVAAVVDAHSAAADRVGYLQRCVSGPVQQVCMVAIGSAINSYDVAALGLLKVQNRLNGSQAYILSKEHLVVDRVRSAGTSKEQPFKGHRNLIGVTEGCLSTEIVAEVHCESRRHEWVL